MGIFSYVGLLFCLLLTLQNHGNPTSHKPELVLNNFTTRLGHRVGRWLENLYPFFKWKVASWPLSSVLLFQVLSIFFTCGCSLIHFSGWYNPSFPKTPISVGAASWPSIISETTYFSVITGAHIKMQLGTSIRVMYCEKFMHVYTTVVRLGARLVS